MWKINCQENLQWISSTNTWKMLFQLQYSQYLQAPKIIPRAKLLYKIN